MRRLAFLILLAAPGLAFAAGEGPTLTFTDGVIAPQRIEVAAGTNVTLTVHNAGSSTAEFESKRLHKETVLAPGATIKVELRGLAAGEYPFVDEFHETLPTAQGVIVAK